MPISSAVRTAGPFAGGTATVEYAFEFKVFADSDVSVVAADSDGLETVLTISSDYTVSLNSDQDADPGGTIELSEALATGETMMITSTVANLQPTDLTNQGGFYPSVITDSFDRATIQIQQLQEQADRALTLPITAADGVSTQLPGPVADNLLGWNADADGLQNYDTADLAAVVAQWIADDVALGGLPAGSALANITETGTGWLLGTPQPNLAWITNNATLILSEEVGGLQIVGAKRTLNATGGASIGLSGVVYNDNETTKVQGWGLYVDAKSTADCKGATWGAEIEITNLGTYVPIEEVNDRKTFGMTISAGGDVATNGPTDSCTFALSINNNGANFGQGIRFGGSSLRVDTDSEGLSFYKALVLRNAYAISWEGASGALFGNIRNTVTDTDTQTSMLFADSNIYLKGSVGLKIAQFRHVTDAVNYAQIYNSVTGDGVSYSVAGPDATIDIHLAPKSATGMIRFGGVGWSATADVVCNGFMQIKDNGGNVRKIMTTA